MAGGQRQHRQHQQSDFQHVLPSLIDVTDIGLPVG
jgi:hypothetical protein